MKFFSAYAYRQHIAPKDIYLIHDTYEEAREYADSFLCDDDDAGVFCMIEQNDCTSLDNPTGFYRVFRKISDTKYEIIPWSNSYIDDLVKEKDFILEIK